MGVANALAMSAITAPREQQQSCADDDAECGGLAERAGHQSEEEIPGGEGLMGEAGDRLRELGGRCGARSGNLAQGGGSGEAVGHLSAHAHDGVEGHEHTVAAHLGGIAEEEHGAGHEGYIEDIVAGASEHLLDEDDTEGCGHGDHPERSLDGANHGDEDTGDEKSILYLLAAPLGYDKLDAEAHDVGHHDAGQHGQKAVEHQCPEGKLGGTRCDPVLVAGVVHAEQEAGEQGHHHDDHGALGVHAVVYVYARAGCGAGCEQERVEAVEERVESVVLSARLKVGARLVE